MSWVEPGWAGPGRRRLNYRRELTAHPRSCCLAWQDWGFQSSRKGLGVERVWVSKGMAGSLRWQIEPRAGWKVPPSNRCLSGGAAGGAGEAPPAWLRTSRPSPPARLAAPFPASVSPPLPCAKTSRERWLGCCNPGKQVASSLGGKSSAARAGM